MENLTRRTFVSSLGSLFALLGLPGFKPKTEEPPAFRPVSDPSEVAPDWPGRADREAQRQRYNDAIREAADEDLFDDLVDALDEDPGYPMLADGDLISYDVRPATYCTSWRVDKARLMYNGQGLLVEGLDVQIKQQMQLLSDPDDPCCRYYVGGSSQAQICIARLLGPQAIMREFYQQLGDVTKARDNTLTVEVLLDGEATGDKFTFRGCLLVNVDGAVDAVGLRIAEGVQLIASAAERQPASESGVAYSTVYLNEIPPCQAGPLQEWSGPLEMLREDDDRTIRDCLGQ